MPSRSLPIVLAWTLGVLCTTATTPASAQESAVESARGKSAAAPASPEARLAHGRALRRAGREGEALTELRRGLALASGKPDQAVALTWEIARTHIDRREFQQAMATCTQMGKLPGASSTSQVCAAEAHLLWRRATEALTALDRAQKDAKLPAHAAYAAEVALGRARELETKDAEAEAAYRAAIARLPDRAEAHAALGALLRRTGKDGLPSLRRAVEIDAGDPSVQLELGRALPAGSQASLAALERAVTERPTYLEALRALAEGYVAARRLPDAQRTADAVLRLAPNDVASRVVSGRVALAQERTEDALRAGEAAFEQMKNYAPAKLLVADAFAKKGEIDLAVEAYQAAIGLDRTDPTAMLHGVKACLAAGRVTSAKAFAQRATRDFPAHAAAWEALGDALAADREPAEARKAYEVAKTKVGADVASVDRKLARLR